MAENESGEKTEDPTGKRLEDARLDGQVAKSPELTTAAFLLGATLTLAMAGPPLWDFLVGAMGTALATAADRAVAGVGAVSWLQGLAGRTLVAVGGFTLAMAVIAVAVQAVQTGGLVTTRPLAPRWQRLNPIGNARRILGAQAIAELAKSLAKMAIVGWAVYVTLRDAWPDLQGLALASPTAMLPVMRQYGVALLRNAGLLFVALAALDYLWQRWRTFEQLRMTKQEVKDEYRQQEGDANVKSRRRAIARERIRRQMFAAVPTADVVIVNPVHIAVALKYDPNVAPAPLVVALGQRKVALRIKELAFQHGVPVIENKPLARALLATAKVGSMIPVELYLAVAEVLAFIARQRERHGRRWRGTVAA
jgi:flagellar biosynthetic protein FlhB